MAVQDPRLEDERLALEAILDQDFAQIDESQWALYFPIKRFPKASPSPCYGEQVQRQSDSSTEGVNSNDQKEPLKLRIFVFLPARYPENEAPLPMIDEDSVKAVKDGLLMSANSNAKSIHDVDKNSPVSLLLNSFFGDDFFNKELLDREEKLIYNAGEPCLYDWVMSIQESIDQRWTLAQESISFAQSEVPLMEKSTDDRMTLEHKLAKCDAAFTGEETELLKDLRAYEDYREGALVEERREVNPLAFGIPLGGKGKTIGEIQGLDEYGMNSKERAAAGFGFGGGSGGGPNGDDIDSGEESPDGIWIEEGITSTVHMDDYGPEGKNKYYGDNVDEGDEEHMQFGIDDRVRGKYFDDESQKSNIKIFHGEAFTEKKSTFQAHLALVKTKEEVLEALAVLNLDNKIRRASHNQYAWRIESEGKKGVKIINSDNNDDGESGAGRKIAELLEMTKAVNVLVVVSRWYGGVHMGPDRFKCISRAAKEVLKENKIIK